MTRSFKPLISAVALAAVTFSSQVALAAYNYTTSITVTAPKGSAAELASKDKTKPSSTKFSPCDASASANGITYPNLDAFNFSVKYDAGKTADEIGDVYIVIQDLSDIAAATSRYIAISRGVGALAPGQLVVTPAADADALDTAAPLPYLARANNVVGTGAQTEVLFGGNLALNGLNKGVWTITSIIAKPGFTLTGTVGIDQFSFTDRSTWAAFDTVPFILGTPLPVSTSAQTANTVGWTTLSATCQ